MVVENLLNRLYAQHSYELEDNCVFRVYNSIIKVTFKENDN